MAVRLQMRVDMRRWILVWLCMGLVGGACSARSLLAIRLTSNQSVRGKVRIEVTRPGDGGAIVRADESQDVVTIDAGEMTMVGFYLDPEVQGDVTIRATLHDGDCDWTGHPDFAVRVEPGQRIQVEITLKAEGCGNHPDAGVPDGEAGTDGAPDGSDGPPASEVPPTLLPDASHDVDAPDRMGACLDYCTTYARQCADFGAPLDGLSCSSLCRSWSEESFSCRTVWLRRAIGGTRCMACPAASPESPGICNDLPSDGPPQRDACPPAQATDAGAE